jgi:nucleoside-diphosphate-sugar epimerase
MSNLLADDLNHILDHTAELWDALRGQRIFVTGGTGFVGRWLLESFAWANVRLDLRASTIVLTRHPEAFQRAAPHLACDPAIKLQVGDITTFAAPDGAFSHVIHAAADMGARNSEQGAIQLFRSIVQGTEHTLEFAVRRKASRFLLISSGAVYGQQPPDVEAMPEEYLGAPNLQYTGSAYGEGKRAAELFCAIYARQHEIQPTIARGFAFFGPHMALDGPYAIGNFLRDALSGGPLMVKGDGSALRSYLYAADMAIWLWTICLRGHICRPYNVGSDQGLSIAETAWAVARCWEPSVAVRMAQQPNARSAVERYVPSVQRARSELGLTQTIDFQAGLKRWIKVVCGQ